MSMKWLNGGTTSQSRTIVIIIPVSPQSLGHLPTAILYKRKQLASSEKKKKFEEHISSNFKGCSLMKMNFMDK